MAPDPTSAPTPSPTEAPDAVLARWLAEEEAVRARLDAGAAGVGFARPEQVARMSGIELFREALEGRLPRASIGATMDFVMVEVEPGRAVFQGRPGPGHLNPMGGVHGGWYATLLDSALGCCVHAALPAGRAYTTLELKLNIVRAIVPAKVPRVRAVGTVVHLGGQTATSEARLVGPDGRLYAHATSTCLIFDLRPEPR